MKNRSALHFVLIIGIANFFADFTYEGARGIIGPFLGSLGASAAIVGLVAGLGELMGYGLRSVSGYFADKSHRHWAFAFLGYTINMLAVPALALTRQWPLAASLVVSERIGRGIRKPTVEAMLSYAGRSIGAGWVFGLNEALDQAGATIGPLLMALILYLNGGYRTGFATLLIPAFLCLWTLVLARVLHPRPHELEKSTGHTFTTTNLTQAYWVYLAAGALLAAGFADFALIGFHFQKANVVPGNLIPVFYAVAMAASALASIPLGRLFDRFGPNVSLFAFLISAAAAPFVFLGTSVFALIGMIF
jgi:Major Facilitator Superfamily.